MLPRTFVIYGRPVSKKNSHRPRRGKSGWFVGNSRVYLRWARDAEVQLATQRVGQSPIPPDVHLHADVVVYLAKRQRMDGDNALGAPFDALQAGGVITNDNQIKSHSYTERRDWDNPRIEIALRRGF